ncbi:MAG: type I restriction-modification system subunit M [Ignavibacteriaceae bacterium]
MKNIGNVVKSIQNIMWKDPGVSGDAQRIEQLGWMLFLKILDDNDKELELLQNLPRSRGKFKSTIPSNLQWRNWAADDEGITGDELKAFVDNELIPALKSLDVSTGNKRSLMIREIFEGTNNYMKNGTLIRQVINKINEVDFTASSDRHLFGDIYETILRDLQSAGNYGEFYTPRALTEFMTEMIDPKLNEKVLDPSCGTGGFLTSVISHHIKNKKLKNVSDYKLLEQNIHGQELKPLPFMLCVTNLILHDIEIPNVDYTNSLNREYTSIGKKDRVNVILANPPFGASVSDGVEKNFPQTYRTTESADLFLLLMIRYLEEGGRAAIVLPDGSLTGEGVKQRIRQHFLESCNLHTIVRLPNSVFKPYAIVATNLLFFQRGKPTKEVWYYQHKYHEGVKSYSKTNPLQLEELEPIKKWWKNRVESEVAWRVSIDSIIERGYDLDVKNPNTILEDNDETSIEILTRIDTMQNIIHETVDKLKSLLATE